MTPKVGFAIHCHHGILVEWCHSYEERVEAIRERKPEKEIETRLRLFKLLSEEAVSEIPGKYLKACAEYWKAGAEYQKTWAEYLKARAEYRKAWAECQKAWAKYLKAYAAWPLADREAFHKKHCGCKEWNGKEIVFPT